MTAKHVDFEAKEGIGVITIDRPPANALDSQMMFALLDIFSGLARWDRQEINAVVLTGTGDRFFCGGLDIKEFESLPPDSPIGPMQRLVAKVFGSVVDCPVPVIGAVNGTSVGGGLAFLGCCDILIGSENARIGMPEINVGLLGAMTFVYRLLPAMRVRRLFYTGDLMDAQEMYRLGALEYVCPPDRLLPEAMQLAAKIASKSPIALRLAKESLSIIEPIDLKRSYRIEQGFTAELYGYKDSKEARRAFMEKRAPMYRGSMAEGGVFSRPAGPLEASSDNR